MTTRGVVLLRARLSVLKITGRLWIISYYLLFKLITDANSQFLSLRHTMPGFKRLLTQARVALDHCPTVICAVDVFLAQILRVFVVLILGICHVMLLYKRQNVLDWNLNFFLIIIKHVFRAFGMFFLRKYFLVYI